MCIRHRRRRGLWVGVNLSFDEIDGGWIRHGRRSGSCIGQKLSFGVHFCVCGETKDWKGKEEYHCGENKELELHLDELRPCVQLLEEVLESLE